MIVSLPFHKKQKRVALVWSVLCLCKTFIHIFTLTNFTAASSLSLAKQHKIEALILQNNNGLCSSCLDPTYCNGNAWYNQSCNSITGECRNCVFSTMGRNCELCKPYFWGSGVLRNCQRKCSLQRDRCVSLNVTLFTRSRMKFKFSEICS